MTLATRSNAPTSPRRPDASDIPPLRNGDHLTREEFHRRYEAMGEGVRAELIEGIVYLWSSPHMPSRVSIDCHCAPYADLVGWMAYYRSRTPGLIHGGDATVLLDDIGEPQPDVLLGIPVAAGGRTKLVKRGDKHYVDGAPDLVAE